MDGCNNDDNVGGSEGIMCVSIEISLAGFLQEILEFNLSCGCCTSSGRWSHRLTPL